MNSSKHLMDLTATDLADRVRTGDVTPTQAVQASLERIRERDTAVNAFTLVCAEAALAAAAEQTHRLARGEKLGPLAGVPLAVKDLEDVAGLPTSHGCKVFVSSAPASSSSVQVARLQAAGAIVVGKTNVPIFGSSALCKNLAFATTRNPWNLERTPGGSSGGSAAAVAARMVPLATGADSGGSIRIPACFCGVIGLKPSFGRIPEQEGAAWGMAKWMRTTHFGPLARSVADAALYLDVCAGHHARDPTSLPRPVCSYVECVSGACAGADDGGGGRLRIGFSASLGYVRAVQPDILRRCRSALGALCAAAAGRVVWEELGARELSLPDMGLQWGLAMGAQSHAMVREALRGREHEVERSIVSGWDMFERVGATELGDVHRSLFELHARLETLFGSAGGEGEGRVDVLATPAMPVDAFPAKGPMAREVAGEPMDSPMHAVGFMYPFNFSGHPSVVVRCPTLTDAGLPTAIQFVAAPHRDDVVLRLARLHEAHLSCFDAWPEWPPSAGVGKSVNMTTAYGTQRTLYAPILQQRARRSRLGGGHGGHGGALAMLHGARLPPGKGHPEVLSTRSMARARDIVIQQAKRKRLTRPRTASSGMRARAAMVPLRQPDARDDSSAGAAVALRRAEFLRRGGRSVARARQPRPSSAAPTMQRAAGLATAQVPTTATGAAAEAGGGAAADGDAADPGSTVAAAALTADGTPTEADGVGTAPGDPVAERRRRELARARRSAFESDLLFALHAHQTRAAEQFKQRSAGGMQVLFQRSARRAEVSLFAWLVRVLFRGWAQYTQRSAEQRRRALQYTRRWRLKRYWVAWQQGRELDRRHAMLRMQEEGERDAQKQGVAAQRRQQSLEAQVREQQQALDDARRAHEAEAGRLRSDLALLRQRCDALEHVRAELAEAKAQLQQAAGASKALAAYKRACGTLLEGSVASLRGSMRRLYHRRGVQHSGDCFSQRALKALALREARPPPPVPAAAAMGDALADAAAATQADEDAADAAEPPFWMDALVRAKFPQQGTRANLRWVDRYAVVLEAVLGGLRGEHRRGAVPTPDALREPTAGPAGGGQKARGGKGGGTKAARRAARPILSRRERDAILSEGRDLERELQRVGALIRGSEDPVIRARQLLSVMRRWLSVPPDVLRAEELAAAPAKGSFGAGGSAGAAKLGPQGDRHFVLQSLLFALHPCQEGEGEGEDGVLRLEEPGAGGGVPPTAMKRKRGKGEGAGGGATGSAAAAAAMAGSAGAAGSSVSIPARQAAEFARQIGALKKVAAAVARSGAAGGGDAASAAGTDDEPEQQRAGSAAGSAAAVTALASHVVELQRWVDARAQSLDDGHHVWWQANRVIVRRAIGELASTCRKQAEGGTGPRAAAAARRGSAARVRRSSLAKPGSTRRSSKGALAADLASMGGSLNE
eukprot:g2087.t1